MAPARKSRCSRYVANPLLSDRRAKRVRDQPSLELLEEEKDLSRSNSGLRKQCLIVALNAVRMVFLFE